MATAQSIRRTSFDRFRELDENEPESRFQCDCGQEFIAQEALKRHQRECSSRSFQCSFCQENYASVSALRDHLNQCGSKTDECPNCRRFIPRSHFAYHYENNCAPIRRSETPPISVRNGPEPRTSANPHLPYARRDIADFSDSNQGSLNNTPRAEKRIPVIVQDKGKELILCEFCHCRCAKYDYESHRNRCLSNPANNRKQSFERPQFSNTKPNASHGIVHIPCEICQEPIDIPNWSNHTQHCRERERQRIAQQAEVMSRQTVKEQLPCQFCDQFFPASQLQDHSRICSRNQIHTTDAGHLARSRPAPKGFLPKKQPQDRKHSASPQDDRSNGQRFAHYQKIDIDRTRAANRAVHDSQSNDRQPVVRRIASEEHVLRPEQSLERTRSNENFIVGSDSRYPNSDPFVTLKGEYGDEVNKRARSSDNVKDKHQYGFAKPNNPNSSKANKNGVDHKKHDDSARSEGRQRIDSRQSDPGRKKRPSAFKRFFGCTSTHNATS